MSAVEIVRLRRASSGPADPTRDAFGDASAFDTCRRIRRAVFIEGQGVPEDIEYLGDEEAIHFLALAEVHSQKEANEAAHAHAVGTARLRLLDGVAKAERVAVLEAERDHGCGRALMRAIEEAARLEGAAGVLLHAQVSVIPFYEKLGYRAEGDVFESAGIDHRVMTKPLD